MASRRHKTFQTIIEGHRVNFKFKREETEPDVHAFDERTQRRYHDAGDMENAHGRKSAANHEVIIDLYPLRAVAANLLAVAALKLFKGAE